MMKWWYLFLILVQPVFASIEVVCQPNPTQVGQELQLIIKQKGQANTQGIPDISKLEQDFQIIGTQQSMSYQIVNGVSEHENIWTILLLPIHSGTLKIPSLKIGDEHTKPLRIRVLSEASVIQGQQNQALQKQESNVFMDWNIEPQKPVLHEAIKLKIDIYHALPLLDAKLSLPRVNNGLLFSVDQPEHTIIMREGKRYEVETYYYLVYPQKLGKLTIHSPVLDALEYGTMPQPVHISLPSQIREVSAIPGHEKQAILPTSQLEYRELSVVPKEPNVMVADALTRTIRITAKGAPYHLIPDFNMKHDKDVKIYVRAKDTLNHFVGKTLNGEKTFEITYIPQKTGVTSIADIEIRWFNTQKRTIETLTIPGFRMHVQAEKNMNLASEPIVTNTSLHRWTHISTWLSTVLGLCLGMLGTIAYRQWDGQALWAWVSQIEFRNRALKKACFKNDPQAVNKVLIVWAQKKWPHHTIYALHDIVTYLPDGLLKQQIRELIHILYAKNAKMDAWDGRELWRAYKRAMDLKPSMNLEKKSNKGLNP